MFGHNKEAQSVFHKMLSENRLRREDHWVSLSRLHGDVLKVIPLMFHWHGNLFFPVLQEYDLCGIYGYEPTDEEVDIALKLFPHIKGKDTDKGFFERKNSFEFLYLMGSAGTLAFSSGSDMDFWIGIERKSFNKKQLEVLKNKIAWIENWAQETHQLELHFFLTDIQDLRQDRFGELGGESCGSALAKLLKDEFYRSMIHIAGKYPQYWSTTLDMENTLKSKDILNIGHELEFKSEELFGAVLWQILKGLHSPFKSLLKIALLEYYAMDPNAEFLCNQLKKKIIESEGRIKMDPYVEMMQIIRAYLHENSTVHDNARLMEECFLIKCLEGADSQVSRHKLTAIIELAGSWGFRKDELQYLIHFKQWRYEDKNALAKRIFNYFMDTYKRLREKAMLKKGSISERDLTVMGKTLRAYLQTEDQKVPFHFSLIEPQSIQLVRYVKDRNELNQEIWALHADFSGTDLNAKNHRLYAHADLYHVCAWHVLNGYYRNGQRVTLQSNATYSLEYLVDVLKKIQNFIPKRDIMEQVLENWNAPVECQKTLCILSPQEQDSEQKKITLTVNTVGEIHVVRA